MPVTLFQSGDAGTNRLGYAGIKGVAGDLVKLLDSVLILDTGFAFATSGSVYTDQTTAWTQMGAGAAMFVNNTAGDICYVGGRQKFNKVILALANSPTLGPGAFAAEYWNGSSWVALVTPTDGTTSLTAAGTYSWSIAAQTGWAQTAVNSVTLYWVRFRLTNAYTTGPTAKLLSIYGWGAPYNGTNGRVYRSQVTSGVQHYFTVNDNGPGAGGGKEARIWGDVADPTAYNTAIQATSFPTSALQANGLFVRKSTDTTTAQTWLIVADEKTCYLFILTADTASTYATAGFGEFYSLVSGDLYRSFVAARGTENSGTVTGSAGLNPLCTFSQPGANSTQSTSNSKLYVARAYTGVGSSILATTLLGLPASIWNDTSVAGTVAGFNGPDGGIFLSPRFVSEPTGHVRGRLRGIWDQGHAVSNFSDGDTWSGVGAISTKTFRAIKSVPCIDAAGGANNSFVLVMETSDTWEAN